jgi:hypothetical protein
MAVINKIDGINISVITKLIGRERAVFAKRTRHTFGGGDQDNVPGLEENLGLTLHGNAQLVNGVLELDGSAGTYASLPHSTDYERESGDLTVSLWFNANSLPGTNDGWGLIAKSTGQHAWDGWLTAYSTQGSGIGGAGPQMTTGGIATYIDQTGSGKPSHNYRAAPAGGLPPGVWHHVAVTMPATGDYSIFVNGESILSWSPASRNTSTNTNLLFGGIMTDGVTKFFSGKIDGVVIQKQILTDQEISDLHAAGRGESGSPEAVGLELIGSTAQTFVRANGDFTNFGDNVDYDRSAGEDFAVELDVNFASSPGSNIYDIVGKGDNNFSSGWAILAYTASGTPSLRMFANTSAAINGDLGFNAAFNPVIGQWYTIKAIWRASGVQELWIDGVKSAERTMSSSYLPPVDSSYDLKAGEVFIEAGKDRSFDGQIRNLVIYKGDDV